MKILHIIDSGGLYGAETVLLNLMSEQVRQGLSPVLASIGEPQIYEKPLEAEAVKRGLGVKKFRMRPGPNFKGAAQVLRFARDQGCHLLHSHGYKGNILFGLLTVSIRRLPMVTTVHGWTSNGCWRSRMGLYEFLDSLSLHCIDQVILVNEGMLNHPRIRGRLAAKVKIVNNGLPETVVDNSATPLDPQILGFCGQGFTFGAIGRLSPEKGFDVLLRAFYLCQQKFPWTQLLILGEGRERPRLESLIREMGLGDCTLLPGYRSSASSYLPFLRGFILPSHTEGLPIVLLEAMQTGIPVVATRVGGIPSVLENGACGVLVAPGYPDKLAGAMMSLLDTTEETRSRVAWAQARVRDKYSSRTMAESYLTVYESLVFKR